MEPEVRSYYEGNNQLRINNITKVVSSIEAMGWILGNVVDTNSTESEEKLRKIGKDYREETDDYINYNIGRKLDFVRRLNQSTLEVLEIFTEDESEDSGME